MKNYQDVLKQKRIPAGALWCDEGVYHITKKLQLMHPNEFRNIFLGLGGFHTEKAVLACMGKFLEDVRVDLVFVANEIIGPNIATSVMNGSHYVRAKHGMTLLSEAISQLQLIQFLKEKDCSIFQNLFQQITRYQQLFKTENPDVTEINEKWNKCKDMLSQFQDALNDFKEEGSKSNEQFQYWSIFLEEMARVLRDLTRSHQEGNWHLHLSAIQRAILLFFAYDHMNYSRWTPLYYEDCLKLPEVVTQNFRKDDLW